MGPTLESYLQNECYTNSEKRVECPALRIGEPLVFCKVLSFIDIKGAGANLIPRNHKGSNHSIYTLAREWPVCDLAQPPLAGWRQRSPRQGRM